MKMLFKQMKEAAVAVIVKLLIMLVCFVFWFNVLRGFNMALAVGVGIIAAALAYVYMKREKEVPLSESEKRKRENKVIKRAATGASRHFLTAFYKLRLSDGITATVYNEPTGEFFKITFRKIDAFEAMQAPDLLRDLQAAEKAEKEIYLKENGYKKGKMYN
jgi:hypothetical protein